MSKNWFLNKEIFKNKLKYYLLKIAPKGFVISIELKNNIKYKLRGRFADKTVLKEVWLKNIYNQFGVKVEDGDLVIDIGAHIGIFSTYAAEKNKSGKIFSFEPFKDNFNRLKFHKNLNNKSNIKELNLGVAGENGKKSFYVNSKNSGGHSLIKNIDRKKEVEIETIRLSDFCKKEKIKKIDFLKIDSEGAEFEIFQKDHSFLNIVKKIIIECHPVKGESVFSILSILKKYNFTIHNENEILSNNKLNMIYASK
jgi:FkbM family methyltransferase